MREKCANDASYEVEIASVFRLLVSEAEVEVEVEYKPMKLKT